MVYELLSQSRKLNKRVVLIIAGWLEIFLTKNKRGGRLLGIREYSKSSNSLWLNLVLQKFCEMICQIIFSKTVRNFLDFLSFTYTENNFILKNNFRNRKITKISKSPISRNPSIFQNNLSAQITQKDFFSKNIFKNVERGTNFRVL